VSVTAPPRPPRSSDPVTHGEFDALVEALIEEARQRARRRRRKYGAAALLVAAVALAAFIGFGGNGGGGAGAATPARARDAHSPAASAQSPPLAALPPGAGSPQAFAFDPRRPNIVYVLTVSHPHGTTIGHVYKTTNGGQHWRATATRGAGWTGDVQSLVADPQHPGTLYAGTDVAVYKTVDGGRSWRPFNRGLFPTQHKVCYRPVGARRYCVEQPFGTPGTPHFNRGNGWVTAIAVDPANTNIVYSGADAVRKSSDGGHSWITVLKPHYKWGAPVAALAIAPTRPESIYALIYSYNTSDTSIYKSTDAGKTWHATGSPNSVFTNPDSWGGTLAVDTQHPTTVYASIGHTLVRTTDAGASWQPITQGLPQQAVTALTVDPQRSGTVYAALYPTYKKRVISAAGGIYKTTNAGDTWARAFSTRSLSGTAGGLAVDPARPTTIYAAIDGYPARIARSTDAGRTWTIAG